MFYVVAASLFWGHGGSNFCKFNQISLSNINLFLFHFFLWKSNSTEIEYFWFFWFLICFVLKKVAWSYKNSFPVGFLQFRFKIKKFQTRCYVLWNDDLDVWKNKFRSWEHHLSQLSFVLLKIELEEIGG